MKQKLLLFLSLLIVTIGQSQTFNDGQLEYRVTDATNNHVSVKKFNNICPVGDVVIPETISDNGITYTVTSLAKDAFRDCTAVASVTMPDTVTSIGSFAFYQCSDILSISIPDGVTHLSESVFAYCRFLHTIDLPNQLESIGDMVFAGCQNLRNIVLPNTVTSIGGSAFLQCKSLTNIDLYEGLTEIPLSTFKLCTKLESINIPESVTSIGLEAFLGCTSLKTIEIPSAVTSIGLYAFQDCSGLESVTVNWDTPFLADETIFYEIDLSQVQLFVPSGTETDYQTAPVWKDFDWTRLSITEVKNDLALRMYPNPVSKYLKIELNDTNELQHITIYNNLGQLISKEKHHKIDVSKYSKGMYVAQIETTKGNVAKKFIVE